MLDRLVEVVDVGANPIEGDAPYKGLLQAGLCRVTGFEPQGAALAELNALKGPNERYFPYVIGDGTERPFNLCAYSGFSGFLEPDPEVVKLHPGLIERTAVIERLSLPTRRLDDIAEIERIDMLKIDVQGAELDVFRSARDKLAACVVVHTEVAFMPFYKGQPSFGEIDVELRSQGFVFHTATGPKLFEFNGVGDANQFIDGDMVYVRDFTRLERMSVEQLEALALIVERCYGSFGLARVCREHIALR